MAKQFLGTRYQSFKSDGTINPAGWVFFYEVGTSTEKTTYSDSALSVANASPVVFNSAGAADIWYDGDADVSVYDSTGTLIDSYPNINPSISSSTVESNLIANGSFEEGGSTTPSGWTRSAPPALGSSAQDLDSSHGLYSWKFTSGGNGAGNLTTTDFFNIAFGRTFTVVWMMQSSAADVRNLVEVVWYTDADAEVGATSLYDNSTTNPTSWTIKTAVAIPVPTAVRAKLRITGCHSSDATSGSTWFDGIQVTEAHLSSVTIVAKEGLSVASATDCNIWNLGDGNTVHIGGTTTITDWGTAPRAGAWMRVIFDGALQLTYNATTNDLPGDVNVTTVANDSCIVYARSTASYQIFDYTRSADRGIIASASGSSASSTLCTATFSPTMNVLVGDLVLCTYTVEANRNGADFSQLIRIGIASGTAVLDSTGLVNDPTYRTMEFLGPTIYGAGAIYNTQAHVARVATAGTIISYGSSLAGLFGTNPINQRSHCAVQILRP